MKTCDTCFYKLMPESKLSPCKFCTNFNRYVEDTTYFWDKENKVMEQPVYNTVTKPKHYMLFEDKGIEVRDVITRLVEKMDDDKGLYTGMDYADYVQAMQYVMRFMDKNGVEDIKKAVWYFNKIIERWDDA